MIVSSSVETSIAGEGEDTQSEGKTTEHEPDVVGRATKYPRWRQQCCVHQQRVVNRLKLTFEKDGLAHEH